MTILRSFIGILLSILVAIAAPATAAADPSPAPFDWDNLFFAPLYKDQLATAEAACTGGGDVAPDMESCGTAGDIYNNMLSGHYDLDTARARFRTACDGGAWSYCNEYGKAATRQQDFGTAFRAFETGCAKDDAKACSNVAYSKYHGQGTQKDVPIARAEWMTLCQEDAILAACHNYAGLLKSGEGSDDPANPAAATELYGRICDEGYKASCAMMETADEG